MDAKRYQPRPALALLLMIAACSAPRVRPEVGTAQSVKVPLYRSLAGGEHVVVLSDLGRPALPLPMLVDTGAGVHIMSAALAWYLGLRESPTNLVMVDAASAQTALTRVEGGLSLGPFGKSELYAAPMRRLPSGGPLGVLSPQALLDGDEAVVVDLVQGSLGRARGDAARVAAADFSGEVCRGPLGWVYLISAQLSGHRVRLVADTGAPQTQLYRSSAAGRALLAQGLDALHAAELAQLLGEQDPKTGPRWAVSGGLEASERVAHLEQQRVEVGGAVRFIAVEISAKGSDAGCPSDGILGLDFLSGCLLVLSRERLAGRCGTDRGQLPLLAASDPLPPLQFTGIAVAGTCPGAAPIAGFAESPIRYDRPLAAWQPESDHLRRAGEAVAAACVRAGYLRADVSASLTLAAERRELRGLLQLVPGPRYRTGVVRLRGLDGITVPPLPLTRLRDNDFYEQSRVTEQKEELRRLLAPAGLKLVGSREQLDDAQERVNLELIIGR